MTRRELTCRELVELVSDYLEGLLAESERARFEEHLGVCAGCRAYLGQFREAIAATGRLRERDVSPVALAALVEAFRGWVDSEPPDARGSA